MLCYKLFAFTKLNIIEQDQGDTQSEFGWCSTSDEDEEFESNPPSLPPVPALESPRVIQSQSKDSSKEEMDEVDESNRKNNHNQQKSPVKDQRARPTVRPTPSPSICSEELSPRDVNNAPLSKPRVGRRGLSMLNRLAVAAPSPSAPQTAPQTAPPRSAPSRATRPTVYGHEEFQQMMRSNIEKLRRSGNPEDEDEETEDEHQSTKSDEAFTPPDDEDSDDDDEDSDDDDEDSDDDDDDDADSDIDHANKADRRKPPTPSPPSRAPSPPSRHAAVQPVDNVPSSEQAPSVSAHSSQHDQRSHPAVDAAPEPEQPSSPPSQSNQSRHPAVGAALEPEQPSSPPSQSSHPAVGAAPVEQSQNHNEQEREQEDDNDAKQEVEAPSTPQRSTAAIEDGDIGTTRDFRYTPNRKTRGRTGKNKKTQCDRITPPASWRLDLGNVLKKTAEPTEEDEGPAPKRQRKNNGEKHIPVPEPSKVCYKLHNHTL